MKKAVIVGTIEAYNPAAFPPGILNVSAPPLAILGVGSYLRANNIPVELIDTEMDFGLGRTPEARRVASQRVVAYLAKQADEIAWVGVSIHCNLSLGMPEGISLVDDIHAALPNTPIILGGYAAAMEYDVMLRKHPFVTAVVRGNGEVPALEISRRLDRGDPVPSHEIPNLAWVEQGEIRTTPIESLPPDEMPIFDFSLLRHYGSYEKIDLLTSRGCPFTCDYCFENKMRPYGAYSLSWLSRQLDHVEALLPNHKNVWIFDPIFGVKKDRTIEICKLLSARKQKFSWGCLIRGDVFPPDLLGNLREAGAEMVFIGVEAISTSALTRMQKVKSEAAAKRYVESSLKLIAGCFENDITPFVGMMLGYPGDSEGDYRTALEFFDQAAEFHERCRTKPGMLVWPQITKVYDNSPLAERMKTEFPDAILTPGPFLGEVFVSSAQLGNEAIQAYSMQMAAKSLLSEQALDRLHKLIIRPSATIDAFAAAHPELVDKEGVLTVSKLMEFKDFAWHKGAGFLSSTLSTMDVQTKSQRKDLQASAGTAGDIGCTADAGQCVTGDEQ